MNSGLGRKIPSPPGGQAKSRVLKAPRNALKCLSICLKCLEAPERQGELMSLFSGRLASGPVGSPREEEGSRERPAAKPRADKPAGPASLLRPRGKIPGRLGQPCGLPSGKDPGQSAGRPGVFAARMSFQVLQGARQVTPAKLPGASRGQPGRGRTRQGPETLPAAGRRQASPRAAPWVSQVPPWPCLPRAVMAQAGPARARGRETGGRPGLPGKISLACARARRRRRG